MIRLLSASLYAFCGHVLLAFLRGVGGYLMFDFLIYVLVKEFFGISFYVLLHFMKQRTLPSN